jgi:hypothetical protein
MNKIDYYRAVLLGVVLGMSSLTLFYMINIALDTKEQPITPKTNFEVVDQYKGCDVVRWTQSNLAEYKYFLHCNNTRPVYKN